MVAPGFLAPIFSGGSFPVVEATNTSAENSNATSHTVNLPSGIQSGDLLIICFVIRMSTSVSGPAGWTQLFNSSAGVPRVWVGYRIADGSEGATATITTGSGKESGHCSYRISGYSGTPEAAGQNAGAVTTTHDPPSLSPSWGLAKTLWIAGYGTESSQNNDGTPANYSNSVGNSQSTDACYVLTQRRELEASSEDPGAFTTVANEEGSTFTIAIKGAG